MRFDEGRRRQAARAQARGMEGIEANVDVQLLLEHQLSRRADRQVEVAPVGQQYVDQPQRIDRAACSGDRQDDALAGHFVPMYSVATPKVSGT